MDDSLRRRLRRLGVAQGLGGLKPQRDEQASTNEEGAPAQKSGARRPEFDLPGSVRETEYGSFWLHRREYPRDYVHGRHAFAGLDALDQQSLTLLGVPDLGPRPAFLDTETTGLAGGAGTLAFLVGVGVWLQGAFVLHLIFMRSPEEEAAALHYLTDVLADATGLVTFNGRGFDVPILETRYILNRIAPTALALPHLDLLAVARQLWRDHLTSRRLGELEVHILDVRRTEQDLDSGLIPWLYRQYLETGDPTEMARVFYHNEIDVLSLGSLLVHARQMVVSPDAMSLAPAEWAGVGRVYDKAGQESAAMDAWLRALSGELGELNSETAARLWKEMGLRHKRRGEWTEAMAAWDSWIASIPGAIAPLVEKAKYFEWTVHQLDEALSCTEQALLCVAAYPSGMGRYKALAELRHRQERLQRRMASRAEAEGEAVREPYRVVLATHNAGKRREWSALLEGLGIELVLPEEIGVMVEIEETGATYEENALLKARTLAEASGLPALADDSGLEVDALDGDPGLHSARFRPGSDEVRYVALLRALSEVPEGERTARFRCLAALVMPDGHTFTAEGICEGVIADGPAGELGFGYDPVFYIAEQAMTMAELPTDVKNQVSHRAEAARRIRAVLAELLGE